MIKTRIVYSHDGKYKIQYKTGLFWKTLNKYSFLGVQYDASNDWIPVFKHPDEAEKLALEISTIEGLNTFIDNENKYYQKCCIEKREYLKRIRPFDIKNITRD